MPAGLHPTGSGRRLRCCRWLGSSVLWGNALALPAYALDDSFDFDTEALRQRGLPAETADYFSRAPRFRPGAQWVVVAVNGQDMDRQPVLFDAQGEPCLTAELLAAVGLMPPAGEAVPPRVAACPTVPEVSPRIETRLQPWRGRLDLTTPPEFVAALPAAGRGLRHGGFGAMLNYRAFALASQQPAGQRSSFRSVDTETGLNHDNWILRIRQNYSSTDRFSRHLTTAAYVQKTFDSPRGLGGMVQAGRLTSINPLFGGLPVQGAQWLPDSALRRRSNYPLEGVAFSRSRVEVRQNGVLLYTTFVPTGRFAITDYPLQNLNADLELRITGESGAQQLQAIPASSLLLAADTDQDNGVALAGGRLWAAQSSGLAIEPRTLALLSWGQRLAPGLGATGGLLLAEGYRSLAGALSARPTEATRLFAQLQTSQDTRSQRHGALASTLWTWRPAPWLQTGVSANLRSAGYRSLLQAASGWGDARDGGGVRAQTGLNLAVAEGFLRGLNASVTRENYFAGPARYGFSLGWGTRVGPADLQVGVSRSFAATAAAAAAGTAEEAMLAGRSPDPYSRAGTYAYVTLTLALDHGVGTSAYARSGPAGQQRGVSVGQQVSDTLGWRASSERSSDPAGRQTGNVSLSAHAVPRYTALDVGVSQGEQASSRYGSVAGSVVATPEGLALASFPVQDSYGLVRLGDVAGLALDTGQGPVWTGPGGLAALPALAAYADSRLELRTRSLPADIEVQRGLLTVAAARGSVLHLDMGAQRVRRLLLTVADAAGGPLPDGAPVMAGGELVNSIGSRGRVLLTLPGAADGALPPLRVALPDGDGCRLSVLETRPRRAGELFETGTARCEKERP